MIGTHPEPEVVAPSPSASAFSYTGALRRARRAATVLCNSRGTSPLPRGRRGAKRYRNAPRVILCFLLLFHAVSIKRGRGRIFFFFLLSLFRSPVKISRCPDNTSPARYVGGT